jgi:hypothetical protein
MPGASEESRHVKVLNANWTPDESGAKADTVMVWDPVNRSLIVANIVGTMPWTVADGS